VLKNYKYEVSYSYSFKQLVTSPKSHSAQFVSEVLNRPNVEGKKIHDFEVEVTFATDGQSVSQYVLVSSTLVGLAARYYFLSECSKLLYD
jgi:hypothetical protein